MFKDPTHKEALCWESTPLGHGFPLDYIHPRCHGRSSLTNFCLSISELVETFVYVYFAEISVVRKRDITMHIIAAVEQKYGSFLKWDTKRLEWVEIDFGTARQKVRSRCC